MSLVDTSIGASFIITSSRLTWTDDEDEALSKQKDNIKIKNTFILNI